MKKYRIKTREEFEKEFGVNWEENVANSWNSNGNMDYLFGLPVSAVDYLHIQENGSLAQNWHTEVREKNTAWIISKDMVKEGDVEKPKTFAIKSDSVPLLKAMYDELKGLGYVYTNDEPIVENSSIICLSHNIKQWKSVDDYKLLIPRWSSPSDKYTLENFDVLYVLPQDYTKALEHAKEAIESDYWEQDEVKVMKFGELSVEVTKGKDHVHIAEGMIKKEDLKEIVDYINHAPSLLGYKLELLDLPYGPIKIGFGCKKGLATELNAIYDAM